MDTNKISLMTYIRIVWLSLQGCDFFTPTFAKVWKEECTKGSYLLPSQDFLLWHLKKKCILLLISVGVFIFFAGMLAIFTNLPVLTTLRVDFFHIQFWEDHAGKVAISAIFGVIVGIIWILHYRAKRDGFWIAAPFFQHVVFLSDCLFPDVENSSDRLLKLHALSAKDVGKCIVARLEELTLYIVKVDKEEWSEEEKAPDPLAYHPATRMSDFYAKELVKRLCEVLELSHKLRTVIGLRPGDPFTAKAWYINASARFEAERKKEAVEQALELESKPGPTPPIGGTDAVTEVDPLII